MCVPSLLSQVEDKDKTGSRVVWGHWGIAFVVPCSIYVYYAPGTVERAADWLLNGNAADVKEEGAPSPAPAPAPAVAAPPYVVVVWPLASDNPCPRPIRYHSSLFVRLVSRAVQLRISSPTRRIGRATVLINHSCCDGHSARAAFKPVVQVPPVLARPLSCVPGYCIVVDHHTERTQTIPTSGIKLVSLW